MLRPDGLPVSSSGSGIETMQNRYLAQYLAALTPRETQAIFRALEALQRLRLNQEYQKARLARSL